MRAYSSRSAPSPSSKPNKPARNASTPKRTSFPTFQAITVLVNMGRIMAPSGAGIASVLVLFL